MNTFITIRDIEGLYKNLYNIINNKKTNLSKLKDLDLEIIIDQVTWKDYDATLLTEWIKYSLEQKMNQEEIRDIIREWFYKSNICKGLRLELKGRIAGVELATKSILIVGKPNISSYTSNIDFAQNTAQTKSGSIGIKLWLSY